MIALGIDCGTQSLKTIAMDGDSGELLASSTRAYDVMEGLPAGHLEQDPEVWWRALEETVGEVLSALGRRRDEVGALGAEARALLAKVSGLQVVEMPDCEVCCGFGGTFSIKYPDISNAMVDKKSSNAARAHPDVLLAGDLGCLMNIAGKLAREGSSIEVRHVAEVLAGELSDPAIGRSA